MWKMRSSRSPSANEASLGYGRACLEESTNKPLLYMDLEFVVVCHIFGITHTCVCDTHITMLVFCLEASALFGV